MGKPVYVVGLETESGRVVVGDKQDLLATGLVADQINLISPAAAGAFDGMRCTAKIRYNAEPVAAMLYRVSDDRIRVAFDEPQSAVAPGQAVVCYDGEVVLGGGGIEAAEVRK